MPQQLARNLSDFDVVPPLCQEIAGNQHENGDAGLPQRIKEFRQKQLPVQGRLAEMRVIELFNQLAVFQLRLNAVNDNMVNDNQYHRGDAQQLQI